MRTIYCPDNFGQTPSKISICSHEKSKGNGLHNIFLKEISAIHLESRDFF